MEFEFPQTTMYRCIYENNKNHLNRIAMEYFGRRIAYAIKSCKKELRMIMADLKLQLYFHPRINKCISMRRNNMGDYYKYKAWFEQDILDGWFSVADIEEKRYKT